MRNPILAVCLLMIASLVAPVGSAAAVDEGNHACSKTENGGGFGDNEAQCDAPYSCLQGSALTVSVSSTDSDALVTGNAACGDAAVTCEGTAALKNKCSSEPEPTSTASNSGTCSANSEETWESPLTVTCEAKGGSTDVRDENPCEYNILSGKCDSTSSSSQTSSPDAFHTITLSWDPTTETAAGQLCNDDRCIEIVPVVSSNRISYSVLP